MRAKGFSNSPLFHGQAYVGDQQKICLAAGLLHIVATQPKATQMSYHRLESSTQTSADAKQQKASGEIWGRAPSTSVFPIVQAYRNQIPVGLRGIEFETSTAPTPGCGTPYEARWYPKTPGVKLITVFGIDYAVISVTVTKNTQVP